MSVEEIASLLTKRYLEFDYHDRRCDYDTYFDCQECIFDWLNEEADT